MTTALAKPPIAPSAAPALPGAPAMASALPASPLDEDVRATLSRLGPRAPAFVRLLQETWADEQRRRGDYIAWLDEDKRAEWIEGEIVVHSPERWEHGVPIQNLQMLLTVHARRHGLGVVTQNKLVRLPRNDFIPDLCYWLKTVSDGFTPTQTIFPPPALVVEVLSDSTAENDRGIKFADYAANGISEYWLIDAAARSVACYDVAAPGEAFALREKLSLASGGELHSTAVAGFRVPIAALFEESENARALASLATTK